MRNATDETKARNNSIEYLPELYRVSVVSI